MQRNFLSKEQKLGKACEPAVNRTEEGDNAALLRLWGVIVPCINISVQTQKADCFCNRYFLSPKSRKAANCAQNAGGQKRGCAVPEWTAITEVDTKKKPGRRITRHYAALLRISNGVRAEIAGVGNEDLVNDVIQRAHQQRDDARNGVLPHQPAHALRPQELIS